MIRPAEPREAESLADFAARLFRETYGGRVAEADIQRHVREAFQPGRVRAELAAPGHAWLVAEGPEGFQAYAQLRPAPAPLAAPFQRPLELARFYVASAHHGHGLAQRLFEAVLSWARREGHDGLWLQVWEESPRARRFYARQGMEDIGTATYPVGTITYQDRVLIHRL